MCEYPQHRPGGLMPNRSAREYRYGAVPRYWVFVINQMEVDIEIGL